ncbi:MAG: hypothetical protein AAF762_05390 [Pseudomonadota bacterium]
MESILGVGIFFALIVFLVWLCIVVPMNMAKSRGRSALLWVVVSLLVSPLVSIVALYALGDAETKPVHA